MLRGETAWTRGGAAVDVVEVDHEQGLVLVRQMGGCVMVRDHRAIDVAPMLWLEIWELDEEQVERAPRACYADRMLC